MDSFREIIDKTRQNLSEQERRRAIALEESQRLVTEQEANRQRRAIEQANVEAEAVVVARALSSLTDSPDRYQAARSEDVAKVQEALGPAPKIPFLSAGPNGVSSSELRKQASAREKLAERAQEVVKRLQPYMFPIWNLHDEVTVESQYEPWDDTKYRKTYLGQDGLIYSASTLATKEPIIVSVDREYLESDERITSVRDGLGLLVVRYEIHFTEFGMQ